MALNLDFVRQDYHSLGPCLRNTMKVLAQGKSISPYVFGDEAGELNCFEMKKGDPIITWSLPQVDKAISCVTLSRFKPGKKQNIFCGSGHIVRGVTQKGKQFFKMETYNTDAIKNLLVDGQKLHTGSDYLLNAYDVVPQEISDSGLFLCEDKINDTSLENIFTEQASNPILACQDKSIRLLDAMKLYYQIPFDSPILALGRMSTYVKSGTTPVAYGTKGGTFGVFDFQKDLPKRIWDIGLDEGIAPGVQVIQVKDFTRSDMVDYIIG